MVYGGDNRHEIPLRLGQEGTDQAVEAATVACTHYDAFRFFTDEAVPHNTLYPTREKALELEQGGCLHANMDVLKWCLQLGPAIPGDLLLDAYDLARDIRWMDMAAAAYDLSNLGVEPIRIETPEGRRTLPPGPSRSASAFLPSPPISGPRICRPPSRGP